MKKKILAAVLAAAVVMLAACGNTQTDTAEGTENTASEESSTEEGAEQAEASEESAEDAAAAADSDLMEINGPQYMSEITAADYVTLGEYKGVEIILSEPEITDEYVEEYIQYVLENSPVSTPVTDRAAETGDLVNIDFEGKLDGVAFDGGAAQGTDLTIGAGGFIEGFEDGIIGMEIGEVKDVEAIFPDPYMNNPDLAGKTAVFTITLNSISLQETPELTDEYVAGLGLEECATVDEYRQYIHDFLYEQEMTNYENEKSNYAIEAVAANAEFKDVPEGMAARMYNTMYNNIAMYASMYGMDVGSYVAAVYGGTAETYKDTLLSQAQTMAQRYIMMQAIAEAEGLTVSDEKMEEELATEAENYGYESAEAYKEAIDVEAYREYLMTMAVIDFISENVVVTPGE